MRGCAPCLARAPWPYLGTLLGREPSAISPARASSRSGASEGGPAAWGNFQGKHDHRFQICLRLAERRWRCLVCPVLPGQGVELAPENEI